jgi:hypothetical protein
MEALAEALAALAEGIAELAMATAELLAALLELLFELLLVLVTQGYKATRERYGQRKEERIAARHAAQQKREEETTGSTDNTSTVRLIVTAIVLAVMGTVGLTVYLQHKFRRQRIEETQIRLATLADEVSQKVRNDVEPLPESGRLADRDAWNRQVKLALQAGVLGTRVSVRSDGPDGQSGTLDDLQAGRYVKHSVKDVVGEIAQGGLDKLKLKAARFLRGQDESEDNAGEPHQ